MADIVLNGESLELSASYRITQVQRSGHFSNDIRQDLTQPFTLPFKESPRNRRILRNINLPQAILQSEKFSVFYEFGGTYYPAEMILRELKEKLQVNIYFDKQALSVLSKNCDDLVLEDTTSFQQLYSDSRIKVWPATLVYFPMIYAPGFFDDPDTDVGGRINPAWQSLLNQYNSSTFAPYSNSIGPDGNGANINSMLPQVALLQILKMGFEKDGYTLAGDFVSNDAAKRAFVFNNVCVDYPNPVRPFDNCVATRANVSQVLTTSIKFPFNQASSTAFNTTTHKYKCGAIGVVNVEFTCTANLVQSSVWDIYYQSPGNLIRLGGRSYVDHTGKMKMTGFINITPALLNGEIHMAVFSNVNGIIDVSDASMKFTMDRIPDALFGPLGNIGQYLPNMPFINFLKETMQGFNLRLEIDRLNKVINLNFRRRVLLKQAEQDLSPYVESDLELEYIERKRYLLKYTSYSSEEEDLNNYLYNHCLQVEKNGSYSFPVLPPEDFDGEVFDLKTHPMISDLVDYENGQITTSIFLGRGVNSIYDTGGEKMSKLRIGFYNAPAGSLPTADHKYILGNDPLDMHLAADPFSVGYDWSQWLVYLNNDNRSYIAICHMPKVFLTRMNIEEPFHINNIKYLVDEVESIIEEQEMARVEFRLKLI